ncbi:hypothetical protein J5N97_013362 [Dioscorea zingiberensis]|uniref:Homeobox-leucine zipper protein n=1 Tax=Dioscorea zingiberensis TaxID=325984 RepID=A0A9D5CT44_9LILI|nr:hypothetical protein J5N97_013362 [Dioscorea zingiberensis]
MAGRRVYGGSNMAALLQNEGIPAETIEALLSPGSNPGGFLVSRNMVNFEDVCGNTSEPPFYRPFDLEEPIDEDLDESLHQPEKKRRLTTEQVRFLEKSFELENKLEPERKIQLARDLGLQPRQVAIWFQNRRARWKTKQLEKDYEALKSSYNLLKSDHDNLLKEKEKLKSEVLSLTEKLLLKEKDKGDKDVSEFKKSINSEPVAETKRLDVHAPIVVCKQEDLSSANSAVLDSDSSHYTDEVGHTPLLEPADSSNALEPDNSDISHAEEDEEVKKYTFLKFEENSGDYAVPVEDQSFWFWNY